MARAGERINRVIEAVINSGDRPSGRRHVEDEKIIGTIEAARRVGIEIHRLYCWEQHGIVRPSTKIYGTRRFRRYSQEDIERALFIKFLVDEEGYTLRAAVSKLDRKAK